MLWPIQDQVDGGAPAPAEHDLRLVHQPAALVPQRAVIGAEDPRRSRPALARLEHQAALDRKPDQVGQAALRIRIAGDPKGALMVNPILARLAQIRLRSRLGGTR